MTTKQKIITLLHAHAHLEDVFFVEEDEDGRVLEDRVLHNVPEDRQRLAHDVHAAVLEHHCNK